jgi:hypothetical protein
MASANQGEGEAIRVSGSAFKANAFPWRFPIKWKPVDRRKRPIYLLLSRLRAEVRAKLALALCEGRDEC